VSPVFAEMHGLPAIYVQVGDLEILLSDATRLRDRIEQSGGEIRLDVWPHMWHVFQFFVGQMPESRHAIDDIGAYLRLRFGAIGAA
jgi:acetyl esterase/lipase